jgi:autonomous glycyl radical cofactor
MIKGIQITQSANAALLNSFWLLDEEKQQARCICAKGDSFAADQEVSLSDLGQFEYRELPVQQEPVVEGGQHLNVNVLRAKPWKTPSPTRKNTRSSPSASPVTPCVSTP